MKRFLITLLLGFLALLIVPVVVNLFFDTAGRTFESVALQDMSYRTIDFENTSHELKLAAMLFVPEGEGPFPAAVIIHGSGSSRRDNSWYLTLTQYLQDNGVVVLLPDKRGSVRSEGDWRIASMEDLATDTVAAIDFLGAQDDVAVSSIGVIGLSQGGMIAPVVADQAGDIAFLVNIVGAAIPMHELLVYEESHNLRRMGVLPGLSDLLAYPAAWSLIELRQKAFWSAIGNFDPVPYWQRLSVRSLTVYGEADTNVPSDRSAEVLRSLQNPNIDVKIYGQSGHALEDPEDRGRSIFREDALADIRDFILE